MTARRPYSRLPRRVHKQLSDAYAATFHRVIARATRFNGAVSLQLVYTTVFADLKRFIAESGRWALSTVNWELVLLYWQLGAVIVRQQEP